MRSAKAGSENESEDVPKLAPPPLSVCTKAAAKPPLAQTLTKEFTGMWLDVCANDPSAGSPTETLLRLLLPLSDKVY